MDFIRHLKIRHQLFVLLFLLLLPLIYFVVVHVQQEIEKNKEFKRAAIHLTETEAISDFLHQLQKERARIIAASEGDSLFLREAQSQRDLTDASVKNLQSFMENSGRSFSGFTVITDLNRFRGDLDRGKLDQADFRNYSRNLLFYFLSLVDEKATGISNVQLSRELQSFKNLTEANVHLGRIRSLMMKIISDGRLSYQDYAQLKSQIDSHKRALAAFEEYASVEALRDVQRHLVSDSYKRMSGIFQELERNPQAGIRDYDPVGIFNLFTRSVEDFRATEHEMISRIKQRTIEESNEKEQGLLVTSILLLITLGLALLLSIYIINLISGSLFALKKAADRIKAGSTDVVLDINSGNEIGIVADSFRGVVNKNIALTKVAQSIGEGNYDVAVEAEGPEDKLSHAIGEMKDSLSRFTTANNSRNWILTGISDLNNLITGESKIQEVSDKVISFLCSYCGSEAGVFYLHDDGGTLVPSAAYGTGQKTAQLSSFDIGTGVVGQAVKDQKITVLEDVQQEYLRIKTGLSDSEPAHIIVLPLQFSSAIVGAVELCTRRPLTQLQQEFLKSAAERISIILHSLRAQFKTQELLYETQNQAEELETQQEELRELNAELKASEEELKVSQEELQEKNAELEEKAQQLEEQFEALQSKNNALEDAREAIELKIRQVESVSKYKSDFLANMSHELRTPLNSILILSRLLADNPQKNLNSRQAEHARIIHKSGSDLLKLINEILDLSKIESGMIRLETEELKVEEINPEPTFRELALNKEIDFKVNYNNDGIHTIYTDRFRLEQILKNFLSNAIKFTNKGGLVEFTVSDVKNKPFFYSPHLNESREVLAFSVKDNGIGIPKEKQESIFEAFQQADTSTTRKFGGTGLGLTICKELAALLGGEIKLESEEGKGSTFTLYLPQRPPQEVRNAPAEKAVPAPVEEKKELAGSVFEKLANSSSKSNKETSVLIIEDDKAFNDILADFALAKNFKVHQSFTGNEGLALAREKKPDAVMLDINLPDISGWEVLQQIREDSELRHVNVHVMSAYDKEVTGNSQQNEEYLPKPVTLEMLNTAFTTISALSDSSIETILIVEDNETENKAIAELLLAHSLQSVSAFSAEEAENILARKKIDCIILDLNLPGMKGHEWMAKIRSTKGLSEIPIIIYSGKDLSEEEEIKLKKLANTIIIKNEYSYLRLLDEVQLFLHKVNQKFPSGKDFKMKLHVPEEILQKKKVLLVDDDVRNVYSLSNLLELEGMDIVEAYDGKEALQKLREVPDIDLVLMDVMMPEMDGIEAIQEIRKMKEFKDLPVIALTAKAMKEDREKCMKAGASDYIPKPVDTDKLLTLMRIWLYES